MPKFLHHDDDADADADDARAMTIPSFSSKTAELINVKKIAFGNKEHTTDKKMGASVFLKLFISSYGLQHC